MQPYRICVTQSNFKHSLGIIRHLAGMGYQMHGSVSNSKAQYLFARVSRFPKKIHRINQNNDIAFVSDLITLTKTHQFDVVIPVGFPLTEFAAKHADELTKHIKLVTTPYHQLELAEDKFEVAQTAHSLNVPAPRTYLVHSLDHLETLSQKINYPIVIKSRKESAKGMVDYAKNPKELLEKFVGICKKFNITDSKALPILQEYIPGFGCGFFALYDHGEIKRIFMHRRIREYPTSGGPSCCAESFYDDKLLDTGKRLLDGMKWHGIAMVECRYDSRDGQYKVIEINPKFWGSFELALAAGADFAHDYVQLALGNKLSFAKDYKHIRYQWPLDGDLLHAFKKPSARKAVLMDLFNTKVHKNLFLSDPLVIITKLMMFFYQLWREVRVS